MVTDTTSGIRHEVQQLIQLQIDTLRLESPLTSSQLWEYHSRSQRITVLYRELNQIRRDRIKHELKTAS
jgi:septal ring factor EnvC (AmiA/AmiB activator)